MALITKYQVFISSTYEDLRAERQQATQAILQAGYFPSGMELFPASDDTQWELIKRVIEESDYYVVIVGGRYGSIAKNGLSYTELEYDYAVSKGIPILGFVRSNVADVPFGKSEQSSDGRIKLAAFREKVQSRTCRLYDSPNDLGMAVLQSLMFETRIRPRTGWIRGDQARSDDDIQREHELQADLRKAKREIEKLKRKLRDRAVLSDELRVEDLAQGDDAYDISVCYRNKEKTLVSASIRTSWDEIFKIIGPSLYGVIQRRGGTENKYPFEQNLETYLRTRILADVQDRKIVVNPSDVDTVIIQLKELGLLEFVEKETDGGQTFRGVALTEQGEVRLTRLRVHRANK